MTALLCQLLLSTPAIAQQTTEPSYNVLLITVDNLRPRNMGVYGYERDTTPFLSSIADESVVFDNAWSTSAWTSPGMSSFFTGYWPPTHGQNGRSDWWDPTLPTAVSAFVDAGYSAVGRANTGPTYQNLGWQSAVAPWGSMTTFIALQAEHGKKDRPFIAWMHLKDVHLPYNKGSAYHRRLWGADGEPNQAIQTVLDNVTIYVGQQDFEFTDDDTQVVRGLYDAAVAKADARIGAAFEQLQSEGMLDNTIVIISADHGEELFEHGWLGHASTSWDGKLFDESWHIPLIVRMPGALMTGRISAPVQQVDLMPTLTELLSIPTDQLVLPMQGSSLLPLMRGESTDGPRPYLYAQTTYKGWATPLDEMPNRLTAVRSDTLKLLRYGGERRGELVGYDLSADPAEQRALDGATDSRFAPLHQAMLAWDAQTTEGAAVLGLEATKRQLVRQREASALGDVRTVMQVYDDLLLADQTFGNEVHPFTEDRRWQGEWQRQLDRARTEVGRSVKRPRQ